MQRLTSMLLSLILGIFAIQLAGCPGDAREAKKEVERREEAYNKPLGTTVAELRQERDDLEDRLQRVNHAMKIASDDAIQFKIWVGVGALVLGGLVLVALGVWTTRRILIEVGIACFGLAGLGAMAAWLVPYILWIGLSIAAFIIGGAIWMLANRERALKQVSDAVDTAKARIPEFKAEYKGIFNEHIDSGMDRIINSVRGVKK
jgi:hypothetical protein